jgi:uncharacterized protein YbjT (DUF2867 family)
MGVTGKVGGATVEHLLAHGKEVRALVRNRERAATTLLTGPAWSGQRVVELGSMVSADEVAEQLGEVLNLDVKAFAVPRAGWAEAFEQIGIPKGHTGPAEEMFEAVNAGWMDLGVEGTEQVAGTTSARDVFEAAQNAAKA